MKYSLAYRALSDIFAAANLPVWPRDVVPTVRPPIYGVVTFVPNGPSVNYGSVSGIVIVDIIVAAGAGPMQAHTFADTLDEFLVKRSHKRTHFFGSSLAPRGPLTSDDTKSRFEYTVSFKFFGT